MTQKVIDSVDREIDRLQREVEKLDIQIEGLMPQANEAAAEGELSDNAKDARLKLDGLHRPAASAA